MAKVILICGKICSGKSYYTKMLREKTNAIILSCDEITFDLSLNEIGVKHDELMDKFKKYFYKKSEEIITAGADVILEFGFWSKNERENVSKYYFDRNITFEWHYIDICDEDWKRNINERNELVSKKLSQSYYVDEQLLMKLNLIFEKPSEQEIDIWYTNKRQ